MTTASTVKPISIDALFLTSWNPTLGAATTVTYSFMKAVPFEGSAKDNKGFMPMNAAQENAVREALAQWSSVANITFKEVPNGGAEFEQLRFGTNDQGNESAGYSGLPSYGRPSTRVDVYINNKPAYNSTFPNGGYGNTVFLHEIGHAIGLKHPGNYNGSDGVGEPPFLPKAVDNADYTIMAYPDGASEAINGKHPSSPMLYDIPALQYIYGANITWRTGDDVYRFTDDIAPLSIWDAGGVNTFDFSATTKGAIINLNAESFSESAPGLNNISIAQGVKVVNAIGGAAADTLIANAMGNTLNGGAGNDTLKGGAGIDTAVYTGPRSAYTLNLTSGANPGRTVQDQRTAASDGTDTLTSVERLQFADTKVAIDLDGHAGQAAKLLGAVFGASFVSNKQFVSIALSLLDQGVTYEQLATAAVSVTGKTSHVDVASLLWTNLFGAPPTPTQIAPIAAVLDNGMTIGALTVLVADTEFNASLINLVGLSQTGIEFN